LRKQRKSKEKSLLQKKQKFK